MTPGRVLSLERVCSRLRCCWWRRRAGSMGWKLASKRVRQLAAVEAWKRKRKRTWACPN